MKSLEHLECWAEQLKDQRWIQMRDEVINRDNHTCYRCKREDLSEQEMEVVPLEYFPGNPWDTHPIHLITMCRGCKTRLDLSMKILRRVVFTGSNSEKTDQLMSSAAAIASDSEDGRMFVHVYAKVNGGVEPVRILSINQIYN